MFKLSARTRSFIFGGLAAAVVLALAIAVCVSEKDALALIVGAVIALSAFTLVSCLILDNNFVGEMVAEVFEFGFVNFPGLIFTLDLDGIIWFLTVKLLFFIIGMILSIICGIIAIILGLFVSLFVYPYAIVTNICKGETQQ